MEFGQLPGELVEEILFRVPPQSLVRFRIVCKNWNILFQQKRFARSQLGHVNPQFIGIQINKIFSIDVNLDDLTVKVCHIYVDIPGVPSRIPMTLTYCDGLLIYELVMNGTVVWNPLLRQGRRIMTDDITDDHLFVVYGIGYNSRRPEMGYKLFGYYYHSRVGSDRELAIYECASDTWKCINAPYQKWPIEEPLDEYMSLNGNSYWTAYNTETSEYFIRKFDFTKEILKHFCTLPCKKNYKGDTHYLSIFRGERFSMLEQCYRTREIEIWVTMNKIKNVDEEDVIWIKFMKVTIPDIPQFFHQFTKRCLTYFVDNIREKSLVICCHDESDQGCIYIVRGDLSRKIELDSMVAGFRHSIYVPSLIPPLLERTLSHDIDSTYLEILE